MNWRLNVIQGTDIPARRYYALMVLGIILPFLLMPFWSVVFLSRGQSFAYLLVCSRFLIWGVLGLMFLYARQAEVQRFFLWSEQPYPLSFYFISIVVLYILVILCGIVSHIPVWLGFHDDRTMIHKLYHVMGQYPVLIVFAALTAGITEEFIFRGYIISRLSLFFKNPTIPVIISALLFSAIHFSYKSLSELIFSFLIGVIFGYHYQKYRNIKVLVIVHFLIDIIAMLPALSHKY